ncbi:MAG: hypothetical protein DI582_10410 [Azospirillum brasilense]|nr:MAG: hypothetical protein DI582_10410 [Azospirillum brasilense]
MTMRYIAPMQWQTTPGLTAYPDALARMATHVAEMRRGDAHELVWLVEHPPLYTAGTSAKGADLLNPAFPVFETGRGGQYTYHGPGQRVAYTMLDLRPRGQDIRAFVKQLEQWIILTLDEFGVEGFTRDGRIGVWVDVARERAKHAGVAPQLREPRSAGGSPEGAKGEAPLLNHEAKIAALGIRVQGWVTSHGIAINVKPDLSHYLGIVPCGIREFGVTSLSALGVDAPMDAVDTALQRSFMKVFGKS